MCGAAGLDYQHRDCKTMCTDCNKSMVIKDNKIALGIFETMQK